MRNVEVRLDAQELKKKLKIENGKDGKTPSKKELIDIITPLIPEPKKEIVVEKTETIKEIIENKDTGEIIVNKINDLEVTPDKQIDLKHIKGVDEFFYKNYPKIIPQKGAGLEKVITDDTLTGDGTEENPLHAVAEETTPASPDTSVQFNDGGVFGGSENFRYFKDSIQLQIGEDNELTDWGSLPLNIVGTSETLEEEDHYIGINVQNKNPLGSSDLVVSADNDFGLLEGHYGDFGITGSAYPLNEFNSATEPGKGYIYISGGGFLITTDGTAEKPLQLGTNGFNVENVHMILDSNGDMQIAHDNKYLNFGVPVDYDFADGETGYGLRNNGGNIEFKHKDKQWAIIPYLELPVTTAELLTLISTSSLEPGAWYLITDYQTIFPVSGTTTFHTGDVEQIYVKATSSSTLSPTGVSKDFPSEELTFDPAVIDYYQSLNGELDASVNSGQFDLTASSALLVHFDSDKLDPTEATSFSGQWDDYITGDYREWYLSGYGKTWEYNTTTQTFKALAQEEKYCYYEEQTDYGDFAIDSILNSDTIVFTSTFTEANIITADFSIYLEDWLNGGYITLNSSNYGTAWTIENNGVKLLEAVADFDLGDVFSDGYIEAYFVYCSGADDTIDFTNSGYLYFDFNYLLPEQTLGLITARNNKNNDLYVQADYRGLKFRRYKPNVSAWTAGTYNKGDFVTRYSYVYLCLATTTTTPSTSSSVYDWVRLCPDAYVLPNSIVVGGHILAANTADYQDLDMFDVSVLDSSDTKISTKIIGDVDLVIRSAITSSINSTVAVNSASTFSILTNSDITIGNCFFQNGSNLNIKNGLNFVISNSFSNINIGTFSNNGAYNITSVSADTCHSNLIRGLGTSFFLTLSSNVLCGMSSSDNNVMYFYDNYVKLDTIYNIGARIYSNTVSSEMRGNLVSGGIHTNTTTGALSLNFVPGFCWGNSVDRIQSNSIMKDVRYHITSGGSVWLEDNIFSTNSWDITYNGSGRIQRNTFGGYFSSMTFGGTAYIRDNTFYGDFSGNSFPTTEVVYIDSNQVFGDFGSSAALNVFGGNSPTTNTLISYNLFKGNVRANDFNQNTFTGNTVLGNFYSNKLYYTSASSGTNIVENCLFKGLTQNNEFEAEIRDCEFGTKFDGNDITAQQLGVTFENDILNDTFSSSLNGKVYNSGIRTNDFTTEGDLQGAEITTTSLTSKTILGTDSNGKIIEGTHQDLSGYAELSGATFTGAITATNLSGTNTGDQDVTNFELELARKISGNSYAEITRTSGLVTQVDYWTNSGKTTKIFTKAITYTSDVPTTITITDNQTSAVMTTTIAYTSGDITSITKAIT